MERAGDFLFVSGIKSRQPDGTFSDVTIAPDGSVRLDIRARTECVIDNIEDILATMALF